MNKFQRLTDTLNRFLEMGVPFYDCIVMKDGSCVYRHMGGFTDLKNKTPVNGKELYNIYSCSKLITCTAALQLWEKGMFSLDDRLSDYMPEFSNMTVKTEDGIRAAHNPILIRHLFNMTAGFSYSLKTPHLLRCKEETRGECQTREVMKYLAKEPLLFEPGDRWEYSLCHDVLAALVEVLTGVTFGEYVKKHIFDVLGIKHSTFLLDDSRLSEIVNQYTYDPEKGVCERDKRIPFKLGTKYESGGAGCISTVDDYIKLLEALRIGDIILKSDAVELMATNQLSEDQSRSFWNKESYGYGLGQQCPKDRQKTDFGWGGAAGAHYFIDRQNGITAYMGTHILGYGKFQDVRVEITPIIQEILK